MTSTWWIALGVLALLVVIMRSRRPKVRPRRTVAVYTSSKPRRQQLLEKQMGENAFAGPRKEYGDIFDGFTIWRIAELVEMQIITRPAWKALQPFYRYLTLRWLARSLESMSKTTVKILVDKDQPDSMTWTRAESMQFDDRGIVEPWVRKPAGAAAVGTMLSGTPKKRG